MSQRRFLLGTNTTLRASRGLYLCAMQDTGRIDVIADCESPDPTFVVLHPRLPLAYAVNETPTKHGEISVVGIDGDRLVARQRIGSKGRLPCHLALLPDARALVVAHYGCGTIAEFELDAGGDLTGDCRTWKHHGRSVDARRQTSAHPHCVLVSGTSVYVTDLGQDCVVHYGSYALSDVSHCAIHAGSGPRHLCIDPANDIAWLSNELDNTVSRLAIEPDGRLREIDWVSSLPAGVTVPSAASEIARHPTGRWLYVGNRGHDSIAWFAIGAGGKARFAGAVATQGAHPRHFALTSDGRALLVANRDSDNLVPFEIDEDSGQPRPLAAPFTGISAPVCVCWL